jgi:hypothetical protein
LTNASISAITTHNASSNVSYSPVEKSMHLKTLIATVLLALSLLLPYAVGA